MTGIDTSKFGERFFKESRDKLKKIKRTLEADSLVGNHLELESVRKQLFSIQGVAKMLKFVSVADCIIATDKVIKAVMAHSIQESDWLDTMLKDMTAVLESYLNDLADGKSADEKTITSFIQQLNDVEEGKPYQPLKPQKTAKNKEVGKEKKFSRERFINRYIEEAKSYLEELHKLVDRIGSKDIDSESLHTDLKNVVHAFKGSSKLLGFNDLFQNLDRLEGFFIDSLKSGRSFSETFKKRFQDVVDVLETRVNEIEAGNEQSDHVEQLEETVQAVIEHAIPVEAQPVPEPIEASVDTDDDHDEDFETVSVGKKSVGKIDRSIFISKFVDESFENIEILVDTLLELEKSRGELHLSKECMRIAHILKGSARMMGFKYQGALLHKMEDLLNEFVNNSRQVEEPHVELLLACADQIKSNLIEIKRKGKELPELERFTSIIDQAIAGADFIVPVIEKEPIKPDPEPAQPQKQTKDPSHRREMDDQTDNLPDTAQADEVFESFGLRRFGDTIRIKTAKLDATIKLVGELLVNRQRSQARLFDFQHIRKLFKNYIYDVNALVQNQESEQAREVIRVSERLLTMLEGQIHRYREDLALQDLTINEIQSNTLKMRMEPLSVVFGGFNRAIRDITKAMKKEVDLVIEGEDTELDRRMIEKLSDPLIHLVRNAIDHGIEPPDERVTLGKPRKGLLRLTAATEGSNIVIRIQDDGRGINVASIREKAKQKKIFRSDEDIEALNEIEVMKLIFLPNFSTAKIITDLSGRGVGLDIVKKNIEEMKGFISVDSIPGKGTSFIIKLPLTLTTIRSLICEGGKQKWAIPISSVRQTLIINRREIIEVVDREAIRVDNQIIPLVQLSRVLGMETHFEYEDQLMVVIGHYGKEIIAFVVDDISDELEVVIKPIPSVIKKIKNVSAVTVSLNGEIIPILFMPELINSAKVVQEGFKEPVISSKTKENVPDVLVIDDSLNTREIEKTILEAYGYRVDTARDGVDGFEKAMQKQYDVVVSDLEMPRMNGFGLIEKLRKEEKYQLTPIIIVTSRENENDKRRGIEVGANAYIIKGSFDQTSLIDTIESLLA